MPSSTDNEEKEPNSNYWGGNHHNKNKLSTEDERMRRNIKCQKR
jgi:hypothetical protein